MFMYSILYISFYVVFQFRTVLIMFQKNISEVAVKLKIHMLSKKYFLTDLSNANKAIFSLRRAFE